jgi:hypothetical protein
MTTNLSKLFNHVQKGAHEIIVLTLMQLIFYTFNSYWVKQRHEANDFIQHGIIFPIAIQIELTMSRDKLRDHTTMLLTMRNRCSMSTLLLNRVL